MGAFGSHVVGIRTLSRFAILRWPSGCFRWRRLPDGSRLLKTPGILQGAVPGAGHAIPDKVLGLNAVETFSGSKVEVVVSPHVVGVEVGMEFIVGEVAAGHGYRKALEPPVVLIPAATS